MEAMLSDGVGDVVYAVGAADGTLLFRTGTEVYAVKSQKN